MDNENGTAAVVTTKVDEQKPAENAKTEIDSVTETVKSAEVANLDEKLVEAAVKSDEVKTMNNSSNDVAVNKTTTTVTVNVTQTKVTVDEVDKSQSVSEVVSTVSSIAEAAAVAIDKKAEQESKNAEVNSIDDVEMAEADTDCEMKDVSLVEEQPQVDTTTSTAATAAAAAGSSETKNVEADSVNSTTAAGPEAASTSNEAEQKIDDVEKNISNLFNGDDNTVSTNEKSLNESKAEHSKPATSSQSESADSLKNGTEQSAKETQSQDTIKDNNDLVSILAGSDKSEENISSSSTSAVEAQKSTPAEAESVSEAVAAKSIDNKLLKGVTSTPSNSTQSTVYNSTPIQKQFEISSENVSTISEPSAEAEHGLVGKAARQEIISSLSSTIDKSTDLSTTATGSETSSSDNIASFAKDVQKINGSSDSTDTSHGKADSPVKSAKDDASTVDSSIKATPKTPVTKVSPEKNVFDLNIFYENSELVYFNVERQDTNKSAISSDKSSISGSVNSVAEPFTLPNRSSTLTSNSSTLSSSSSEAAPAPTNSLDKTRQEIKGTVELCTFIIDHFEKLRAKLTGKDLLSTPATSGRRGRNAEPTTPSLTNTGSKRKRGAPLESPALNDTDSDVQPKSAKKAKKEPTTPKAATESDYPEKAVLARWVDKKFYAGRVIDQKPNNKFVVLFVDGAKKTLPDDHIVFGKDNILPLVNEHVHALVEQEKETYEPGVVQSVETKDDEVYYTVACESTTVTVTASGIYLEEDQAKVILSKHASNNPEPGFSGGLSTRKDRRNKRAESNRQVQWFSESDVSDINESDSRPASPVTVSSIEAVDGVQPELQHTQKESELVRICYLMERFGSDFRRINLDSVLGPINQSNILKNKSFLLTCTIPIKSTNGTTERQNARNNGFDLSNRNTVFSTVPFFKDHLKQQIESAGGTVYNNFENVPTNKYRSCFLLSPFPCITAKYVQCLASNITAVSHEWIVESCQQNKLQNKDSFVLPSGWSIVEGKYKPWSIGRGRDQRKNAFSKTTMIITSQQSDFVEFWSRVCKAAGAKIRLVKSTNDITATTKGYILLDDEFPPEYQSRAERFHIPIVSTVWVIQSLILGKVLDPTAHPKLTQLYEDDYF